MTREVIDTAITRWDPLRELLQLQNEMTRLFGRRRIERRFGQFTRSVTLPGQVDADKIDAQYRDGVLTLTVPKTDAAKPKRITVKAAGA